MRTPSPGMDRSFRATRPDCVQKGIGAGAVRRADAGADNGAVARPGQLLAGRYRIDRVVRRGGMAVVFAAFDTRLARTVAVKVLHFDDPSARSRFDHEVRLLASLDHPGLVRVYDAGEEGDDAFYVMELVDGPSLADQLAQGALPEAETVVIGRQVAEALAFIHERGIVHRDVKPSNILLAPGGPARLADFGIARLLDSARMTSSGLVIGTAAYLAPEQITDGAVGPAADIYALAIVINESVTGRPEFAGTPAEVAAQRLSGRTPVPAVADARLGTLLAAMLVTDPDDRPPARDVGAMLAAIGKGPALSVPVAAPALAWPETFVAAAAPSGSVASAATSAPGSARSPRVSRALIVAAAVLALLVVAFAAALLARHDGSSSASADPPTVPVSTSVTRTAVPAPPTTASTTSTTVELTTTSTTSTTAAPTFGDVLTALTQTVGSAQQADAIRPNVANHVLHTLRDIAQQQGDVTTQVASLVSYISDRAAEGSISQDAAAQLTTELHQLQATV